MKNALKYMAIIPILLFIGCSGVEAKTCEYNVGGMAGNYKATLDITNEIATVTVNVYYNDTINKKARIANWDAVKEQYKSGVCPNKILINQTVSLDYTVLLGEDSKELEDQIIATGKKTGFQVVPCINAETESGQQKQQMCDKAISEATKNANEKANTKYTTDDCKDTSTGKYYTAFTKCSNEVDALISTVESEKVDVDDLCLKSNYMTEKTKVYENYITAYSLAITNLRKYRKRINKEISYYQKYGEEMPASDTGEDAEIAGCSDLGETLTLVRQIYNFIRYLIPVLIIVLSIVDFLKTIVSGEEKAFKEVWNKFVKRIIVGIIILLLPILLSFVINISGALNNYDSVDSNNIFCIFK